MTYFFSFGTISRKISLQSYLLGQDISDGVLTAVSSNRIEQVLCQAVMQIDVELKLLMRSVLFAKKHQSVMINNVKPTVDIFVYV